MTRDELRKALEDTNVRAFLRVIREGESNQRDDAYRIMFGGEHFEAPPWEHPGKVVTVGRLSSTAAGAYQFLLRTWNGLVKRYGFEDFSPKNQDLAAVALIDGRGALGDVIAGRLRAALDGCAKEWASLPGSPYGQPTLTYEQAETAFRAWGGEVEQPFNPDSLETEHYGEAFTSHAPMAQKETDMAVPLLPIFTAVLPQLVSLIPALAGIFKPGSEVAERNVAAATIIAEKLVEVTGAVNVVDAAERMRNDNAVLESARRAMDDLIPSLVEFGGGIQEARKVAFAPDQVAWYANPAVIMALAILPLVYLVVSAVVLGVGGQSWSDDVKTLTVTAVLSGALGSITGFFLGSSLSSQKKDVALTRR